MDGSNADETARPTPAKPVDPRLVAVGKLWQARPDMSAADIVDADGERRVSLTVGGQRLTLALRAGADLAGVFHVGADRVNVHDREDRLRGQALVSLLFGSPPGLAQKSVEAFVIRVAREIGIDLAERLPVEQLVAAEAGRINALRDRFLADRDQATLKTLVAIGKGDDLYAWRWYVDPNAPNPAYRRQARESWPFLAADMARTGPVRRAIDRAEPLAEAMLATVAAGIDKSVLARLRGIEIDTGALSPRLFLETVATLPVDWLPKGKADEIQALANLLEIVTGFAAECDLSVSVLLREAKGKWKEFRDRLLREAVVRRVPENATEADLELINKLETRVAAIADRAGPGIAAGLGRMLAEQLVETHMKDRVDAEQVFGWISAGALRSATPDALLAQSIEEIVGMSRDLCDQLILPAAALNAKTDREPDISPEVTHKAMAVATTALLGDKGLVALLEQVNAYKGMTQAAREEAMAGEDTGRRVEAPAVAGAAEPEITFAPDPNDPMLAELGLDFAARFRQWAMLTRPVQAPNGLWIAPLHNDVLLRYEGSKKRDPAGALGLHHCCASMNTWNSNKCLRNGHHILSVRRLVDGQYYRVGTVEYSPIDTERGPQALKRIQFRYFGNGDPPPEGLEALAWYEQAIETGEIPLYLDGIRNRLQLSAHLAGVEQLDEYRTIVLTTPRMAMVRVAGYDWQQRDNFSGMLDAWRPALPKSMRKLDADGLIGSKPVRQLSALMMPEIESIQRMRSAMPRLKV